VEKYNNSFSQLLKKNATHKEYKTFLKFLTDEANRKQRQIIGLD
jgi:hypothetical protein